MRSAHSSVYIIAANNINLLQRLRELEEAVSAAQEERTRIEGEARRQEQLYAHNVRLLQEAATHLEEKLVNKQEVRREGGRGRVQW